MEWILQGPDHLQICLFTMFRAIDASFICLPLQQIFCPCFFNYLACWRLYKKLAPDPITKHQRAWGYTCHYMGCLPVAGQGLLQCDFTDSLLQWHIFFAFPIDFVQVSCRVGIWMVLSGVAQWYTSVPGKRCQLLIFERGP